MDCIAQCYGAGSGMSRTADTDHNSRKTDSTKIMYYNIC
jgi:hypothetical protein